MKTTTFILSPAQGARELTTAGLTPLRCEERAVVVVTCAYSESTALAGAQPE